MAKAWTPSRSAIYGAPVQQAAADLGGTMMDIFAGWGREEVQALYVKEKSAGLLAIGKERNRIYDMLTSQYANDPTAWSGILAKEKEQIRKGVLSGIKSPYARQAVELDLDEQFFRLDQEVAEARRVRVARNAETNYVVGKKELYDDTTDYVKLDEFSDTALQKKIAEAFAFFDENHNADGLPVHQDVATPEALEYQKRLYARKEIGEYAAQMALAKDDLSIIDNINDMVPGLFPDQDKNPIFDAGAIAEIKDRVKRKAKAAKAEVETLRQERAEQKDRAVTKAMLNGQHTIPDENGKPVDIREMLVADEDITPARIDTLVGMYDDLVEGAGKKIPLEKQDAAYAEWAQARMDFKNHRISREQLEAVRAKTAPLMDKEDRQRAAEFGPETTQSLLDDYQEEAMGQLNAAANYEEAVLGKALRHLDGLAQQTFQADTPVSREEYMKLVVNTIEWMQQQEATEPAETEDREKKGPGGTRQAFDWLTMTRKDYDAKYPSAAQKAFGGATATASVQEKNELPQPKTKEEFDALPSGTEFIDPDGKRRRKP